MESGISALFVPDHQKYCVCSIIEDPSIFFDLNETERDGTEKIGDKKMKDNGGRRLIIDRRKCSDFDHFPERRALRFRRSDLDRRKGWAENNRIVIERRAIFR